jgi:hypothetical protein
VKSWIHALMSTTQIPDLQNVEKWLYLTPSWQPLAGVRCPSQVAY